MKKDLYWQDSIFSPPESRKVFESLPMALADVVAQKPNSPAVMSEGKTFSFLDLAHRVAGLSDEINELPNHPGPIALLQKIGLDAIAAWFACALSGRPFLLLDPDSPPARTLEFIKSSGCAMALVDHSTSSILAEMPEMIRPQFRSRCSVPFN